MDPSVIDLVKKTVPEKLYEEVNKIFDSSKASEEERLKDYVYKHTKFSRDGRPGTQQSDENKTKQRDVETTAIPLAIARVMMQLWSSKMFRYAENLILTKAIQEKYFEEKHKKHILVFEQDDKENDSADWIIEDQDEVVVDLVWNKYNIKKNYDEVCLHRSLIQQSYDRLKEYLPELHPEIIERHDLSKYAFSQSIGYTLKFVHGVYHPIWKAACDLHLQNEPHHPQAWTKKFSPEQKRQKVKDWTRLACDLKDDCAYGVNLATLKCDNELLPVPFLLESYVDMVAIEWERKKGQRPDITNSDLIYMDEKYLMRYTNGQRKMISDLVSSVISNDKSWKTANLAERESMLLSTIPEKDRGPVLFRMENQKKYELTRLEKRSPEKTESQDVATTSSAAEEISRKAANLAFYNTIANVIMSYWDNKYRKYMEQLLLKRAIKEGFIKEYQMKWIFVFEKAEDEETDLPDTASYTADNEAIIKLIWEEFNMREHFQQMKDHRYWLKRSYERISKFVPELPEEVIERHDLSKFAFSQSVGYTLKWVHDISSPIWKRACDLHLNREPHHPQMWYNRHSTEYKQSSLESFLCIKAGGDKYGLEFSKLNLTTENMALVFLLESFVDMIGVEWERNKGKKEDLTYTQLVYMEDHFLNRYSAFDKNFVLKLMQKIRENDKLELGAPT